MAEPRSGRRDPVGGRWGWVDRRRDQGRVDAERSGGAGDRWLGGRYRLGELVAAGGMGEVWAAEDVLLERPVAVKLLGVALAGDGRAAERLRREARAAARLDHPNIARVLDLGEQDGRPYLVMELLRGESLAARLARAGPMAPAEAAEVVARVADALQAAHRAGVVHRDIKPGNVFLTRDGDVKVLDFGIAGLAQEAAVTTGERFGTPAYLAPERVLGQRATEAADVYATGVLLYELVAGRRPFEADSDLELAMAHVNATPPPLDHLAPAAPPHLVDACARAMAKDPASRPSPAAAFAHLLRNPGPAPAAVLAPLPGGAGRATATRRLPGGRRRGRRRGRLGLAAAVLVLAAALLAAAPNGSDGLLAWVGRQVERAVAQQGLGGVGGLPGLGDDGSAPGVGGPSTAEAEPPAAVEEPGLVDPPPVLDPPARRLDGGNGDRDGRDRDDGPGGRGRSGDGDSDDGGSSGPG